MHFSLGLKVIEISASVQVLDATYLEKYYKTRGAQGYSMQDLQSESMADPETVPFESRSIDMRVLTGQTSLFYSVTHRPLCMHRTMLPMAPPFGYLVTVLQQTTPVYGTSCYPESFWAGSIENRRVC